MGAEEKPGEGLSRAVIGAGPGKLAAAYDLARRGTAFTGFGIHTGVDVLWDIESPESIMHESAPAGSET